MIKKVLLAAFIASIFGVIIFYLVCDLLGNQIVLKGAYQASESVWRNPALLTRDPHRLLKFFTAFFLTNIVWAYVFSLREKSFEGSGVQKGISFFFLFWILCVPVHLWSWVIIPYPKKIMLYNVLVYYLILFLTTGAVIGKVCSEEK